MAAKRMFAVCWTDGKGRFTRTKKRGTELMRVWKDWQERHGLRVVSFGQDAYMAYEGERQVAAIVLREYDAVTGERAPQKLPETLTDAEVRARYIDAKPVAEKSTKRGRRAAPAWA